MDSHALRALLLSTFGKLDDKQIMALTIWGESRGEIHDGKIAVGTVILNRVDHHDWEGNTIQAVCLCPYQFSCYLPNDPNEVKMKSIADNWDTSYQSSSVLQECYEVASGLIDGTIPRTPILAERKVCQYKTVGCEASWADVMILVTTIGHQEFWGTA